MSAHVYHSQRRRFAVWVTLGDDEVILKAAATDGHPLDVAPFAVLARDEVAALHADLGAWLEATP